MQSSFVLQPLEKALNSYLALDPESGKRLQALEGKTLSIHLKPLSYCFQLHIINQKVQLNTGEQYPADTTIKGTPLSLLCQTLSSDKTQRFFSSDLSMEGDAELGQQMTELFEALEIDWEEYLSHLIGDLPSHELSRFTKGIISWGKQAKERLLQNTNEYIHEEKPWFPPRGALEGFFQDVDELRMDLDRLEARIKHL